MNYRVRLIGDSRHGTPISPHADVSYTESFIEKDSLKEDLVEFSASETEFHSASCSKTGSSSWARVGSSSPYLPNHS